MNKTERLVRQLAAAQGLASLSKLARAARVDRQTIFFAVRGTRIPRAKSLKKIALALGVTVPMLTEIFAGAAEGRAA